jgi:DNA-binding IclR family transcriptional regulator
VAKVADGFGVTAELARITAGPGGVQLSEILSSHLQTLVALTNETSGLNVRMGDMRRCVAEIEGHHDIRWARGVGFTAPVWSGAVGHVILAGLKDEEISEIMERTTFSQLATNTATGPSQVLDRVRAAAKRGWSLSVGETVEGAAAVAAPVQDHQSRTIGVLSLYAPANRFDAIREFVPELLRTAESASAAWIATTIGDSDSTKQKTTQVGNQK